MLIKHISLPVFSLLKNYTFVIARERSDRGNLIFEFIKLFLPPLARIKTHFMRTLNLLSKFLS
ncbi:MAG: hypothetical protein COX31_02595 [Candidatus Moranbacteria bacterium CG23_combo_of_CG06-09_8_20_14_all_40_16]|nr:MAG: hypothetical protein COX31_02595 [Candidatus Moranbacteria bacterium CG23_combo_of_CG06-09_8_20_14_all_40_16]